MLARQKPAIAATATNTAVHVPCTESEFKAIDTAMGKLDEGDLCLILVDQIDEALAHIAGKLVEDA